MATTTQTNSGVSQLYVALFGRAPDAQGLNFWAGLLDSGQTLAQVADTMFGTAPARAYFPDFLTNQEIISSFYLHVLGRAADTGGLAFWTAKLDAAGATPGSIIAEMIEVVSHYAGADPAGLASAALFNNRSAAAQFYAEHNGSLEHATSVLAGVNADASTVAAARTMELSSTAKGAFNVGGFTQLWMGEVAGDVVFTNAAAGTTLTFTASPKPGLLEDYWNITYLMADSSGGADAVTFVLASAGSLRVGHLATPGIEHVTFSLVDLDEPEQLDSVTLIDSAATSVTVSGSCEFLFISDKIDTSLALFDASGAGGVFYYPDASSGPLTLMGSAESDLLQGTAFTDTIVGGAGQDSISSAKGMDVLTGGPGADFFAWFLPAFNPSGDVYPTITDFTPSTTPYQGDSVNIQGFVNEFKVPYMTKQMISLGTGAAFHDYLNAGATGNPGALGYVPVHWFRWQGDTFLVIDNSNATTFQNGVDQVVKFTGLIDLGVSVNLSGYVLS